MIMKILWMMMVMNQIIINTEKNGKKENMCKYKNDNKLEKLVIMMTTTSMLKVVIDTR